jgi:hypothetical protein
MLMMMKIGRHHKYFHFIRNRMNLKFLMKERNNQTGAKEERRSEINNFNFC